MVLALDNENQRTREMFIRVVFCRFAIVTMRNPNISKKIFSATNRPLLGVIPVTLLLLFNMIVGGGGSNLSTFTVGSAAAAEKSNAGA